MMHKMQNVQHIISWKEGREGPAARALQRLRAGVWMCAGRATPAVSAAWRPPPLAASPLLALQLLPLHVLAVPLLALPV